MSTVEFDAPECITEEAQHVPEMIAEEAQSEPEAEAQPAEVTQPAGESETIPETSGLKKGEIALVEVRYENDSQPPASEGPASEVTTDVDPKQPGQERELISDGVYEWEHACDRLQEEISDLTIERLNLSERQKSIKKRIDCLAEELADLRSNGPQAIWRTDPPARAVNSPADQESEASANTSAPSSPAIEQTSEEADAWRDALLSDLELKKGIHTILAEAGIETIGQLEDLRAAISLNKKEWPKGIGKAKITEIEDAVISWLTKHRDAGVFGQTSEVASTPEVQIQNRAKEIHTGKDNSLESKHPEGQQWHESGWHAYGRQVKLEECPYIPGPEQDDWIRGWLARDVVEKYEKATNQEEATEVVDQEIVDVEPGEQPALPGNANAPALIDQAVSLADL